jgi:hypothetical protein
MQRDEEKRRARALQSPRPIDIVPHFRERGRESSLLDSLCPAADLTLFTEFTLILRERRRERERERGRERERKREGERVVC